ncbi:MAG: hypothetical protein F6K40_39230 [Okeania sp. SIO3I5]|uniref:hypothetical protein n=1 Tax=Okeania sp. SIO3I5 TaxID=2607805 RepID=UPI0013B72A28|nr:hypothetical protein [Okeania sp. SIO3I5]NEQ41895.1 hypothetical protein [Okeania sp. SIO3I5]
MLRKQDLEMSVGSVGRTRKIWHYVKMGYFCILNRSGFDIKNIRNGQDAHSTESVI